jgi:tetratricopeptide (TPR) repeat protein
MKMRITYRLEIRSALMRRAAVLATVCAALACSTTGAKKPGQVELQDQNGFTLTEQARFSAKVRGSFEEALRLIEQDEQERGMEMLREVTEAAPDATAAHIDLGIAYRQAGRFEEAEASLQKAVELSPRHPAAHNELGIVYRKTGRFEEARASYQQALAVYPDFHYARRNLAILCDVYLGDMECAVENYQIYSQMMPEDESVAMWIADLNNRLGR